MLHLITFILTILAISGFIMASFFHIYGFPIPKETADEVELLITKGETALNQFDNDILMIWYHTGSTRPVSVGIYKTPFMGNLFYNYHCYIFETGEHFVIKRGSALAQKVELEIAVLKKKKEESE